MTDIVTIRYNSGHYEVHDHIENADYTKVLFKNGIERGFSVDEVVGIVRKIVSEHELSQTRTIPLGW